MKKITYALLLSFVAATLFAGSRFAFDASGILSADTLSFRIVHFSKGWKLTTEQGPKTVEFPGAADAEGVRRGTFRAGNGEFRLTQTMVSPQPERATVAWELASDEPVESEGLFLTARFPVREFLDRPLLLNGKALNFGAQYDAGRWRAWGGKRTGPESVLEIPLSGGRLFIRGDFTAMLQDNRRYSDDSWSLRIHFSPGGGAIGKAGLKLEFEFVPWPAHTLDLRKASNLAFRDETADDRRGGWPDQGPANDLSPLPAGRRDFRGIVFDILDAERNGGRSCIALRGKAREWLPDGTAVEAPGISGRYLYLLNALGWETPNPAPVGEVLVRYADGGEKGYALVSGADTANFWKPRWLERGIPVWKGENPSSEIGLYATRIELERKPLKEIVFRSAGNAVWLIAAATVTDAFIEADRNVPVVMEANDEWRPVGNPKPVAPGSIVDFSGLLDAPAGKYGPVRGAGERFEFAERPGVPARFWGINLCADCNFPDAEQARRLTEELAAAGYNLVRFHQFDNLLPDRSKGSSTTFDPEKLDRFDRLLACCKERGIYASLDLFSVRGPEKGELPEFPDRVISGHEMKALIFIRESAMRNWEAFSANLLNHVNPYTGLAWKEDPAIVNYCLVNEDTLSSTSQRSAFVRELYEREFREWLERKKLEADAKSRPVLWTKFLQETSRRGHARMAAFLRSIGAGAPVTGLNFINDNSTAVLREGFDLVDSHGYWAHPQFIGKNWRLPAAVDPECPVRAYGGIGSTLFTSRIFGKPYIVTEWDYTWPNPYGSAGAFLAGAYASLQGHAMMCRFNYAWTIDKLAAPASHLCFFDMANAPLRLLSERAGALFYLRGDVAESGAAFPVWLDRDFLDVPGHSRWMPQWTARAGLIGKCGVTFEPDKLPPGSRALLSLQARKPAAAVPVAGTGTEQEMFEALRREGALKPGEYDPERQSFRSSTGELALNRNAGSFQAVTPLSEGFVGPGGTRFEGKFARVAMSDGWSSVLVASRDGRPLAESGRILILHLTDCRNTGTRFANSELKVLERYGTLPLLMRRGVAELALKAKPGMRLYACGFDGRRLFELPARYSGGELAFRAENITPHGAVAVYELTK
ncbi:MAG: hypothetical protein HPZ91_02655 [Lentisphaeria bacterium]|nr:hypothetical protein [Lentisphaeria bacterium]